MSEDAQPVVSWEQDKLGRHKRAQAFTNIIGSNNPPKVISIEAEFGMGKSFFAERWANDLRDQGHAVIEFDAWRTDQTTLLSPTRTCYAVPR